MLIAIFKKENANSYKFIGSGFLISKNGIFVSCGHNFLNYNKNPENYYCAVPNNENSVVLYDIKSLKKEHCVVREEFEEIPEDQPPNQKAPIYRDLAIGEISGNFTFYFILNRKRPLYNEKLNVIGYRNPNQLPFSLNDDNSIDISSLVKPRCDIIVDNRDLSIFTKIRIYFTSRLSEVPNSYKYNNSMMLEQNEPCDDNLETGHGMSGCPIFDEKNLVVGIYLGSKTEFGIHYMVCAKYISKFIRYKTVFPYDIYSDLPLRMQARND